MISPVFHNDVRSQFELSSKLRKQNDNSFINVSHHICKQNNTQSMLCYRFYLEDYRIYHKSLKENLVYNLKLYLSYNCQPNCENDVFYHTNMMNVEFNGFLVDSVYTPVNKTAPISKITTQFFAGTINSFQYSSIDIKMKRKRIVDDKSYFQWTLNENLSTYLALDKSFSKYYYYDKLGDNHKKIIFNLNIDLISRTTEELTRKYEKFEDILTKMVTILLCSAVIFYFVNYFFSSRKHNLKTINKIFDFYDDNEKMNFIKTKKMLERKSVSMINLKEKLLALTEIVTEDNEDEVKIIDQTLDLDVLSDDNKNIKQGKKIISCKNIGAKKRLIDIKDKKIKESVPSSVSNYSPRLAEMGFKKFKRKHQIKPLEKIEEENIEELKKIAHKATTFSADCFSRKESLSEIDIMGSPNRKFHNSPIRDPSKNDERKLRTHNQNNIINNNKEQNMINPRKDSNIISDIILSINSKKKLNISCCEFIGIALGLYICNFNLKKKNDLYKQSLKKIEKIVNPNKIMEKCLEIEKLKFLLFNKSQNYAFSFLSKPIIIYTVEGNILMERDIMRTRKETKRDSSKEESIKELLHNSYDCKNINQKLVKLINFDN